MAGGGLACSPPQGPAAGAVQGRQPGGDARRGSGEGKDASVGEQQGSPSAHEAVLRRHLSEPWGWRTDKDDQLVVPMVDYENYKRVRYWAVEHFTGFSYGDDHDVMNAVFIRDLPEGTPNDSRTCMQVVESWGRPQLRSFEVVLGTTHPRRAQWRGQHIEARVVDGHVDLGFERVHFSAGWAAYPAYPNACMVFGIAVPWNERQELARQVVERWIREGVPRLAPKTEQRPYRKD